MSTDHYPSAGDYSPVTDKYDALVSLVNNQKLVALTENGAIPDPDLLSSDGTNWSWFTTWTGEFLTDGVNNSREHLNKVFNHPNVITLDELPDVDHYGQNN
ncbi:Mannan endo-1,4-beta-mannosidase [compost metagenome]